MLQPRGRYGVISLFDGVSSVVPLLKKKIGFAPVVIVLAENDNRIRSLVCNEFFFPALPIEYETWWEQCKDWMQYFKGQSAPMVLDLHGLLAFRWKEEGARAEVEAFMEHCAKRWQTKEGTYQLSVVDFFAGCERPA